MIALCLIRIAMLAAGGTKNAPISSFSFSRALTETRILLSSIVSGQDYFHGFFESEAVLEEYGEEG